MKTLLAACALLTLTSCAANEAGADDPAGPGTAGDPPTSVPAAPGTVQTRTLALVMDTGTPELCLGPIAQSYPPQCSGLPLAGWNWDDHDGVFERSGDIRWGQFAVTGTFDGTTFTVTDATPAALYDTTPEPDTTPKTPPDVTDADLSAIAEAVGTDLPGAQGAYVNDGHVLVDVIYDDGTLQEWADDTYGQHVVIVTGVLTPTA